MEDPKPPDEERRRHPRFPLNCPIAFSGDLLEGKGTVMDISKLGCAVQTDKQVKEGTYLNLFLRLPEGTMPLKAGGAGALKIELAVVRWVRVGQFGVEFIRVHPKEQDRLYEVIRFLEMLPRR
jgi:hypothetical protein